MRGGMSMAIAGQFNYMRGEGGDSFFASRSRANTNSAGGPGQPAAPYGGGGSGGANNSSSNAPFDGSDGADGVIVVEEYS